MPMTATLPYLQSCIQCSYLGEVQKLDERSLLPQRTLVLNLCSHLIGLDIFFNFWWKDLLEPDLNGIPLSI